MDVTVAGSQKGLMLPPGLSFNAVSDKAIAASKTARLPRAYWRWDEMIAMNRQGYFPYHAGDQPALRPARGDRDAARGRPARTCSRATRGTPRPRGAPCAAGDSTSCAAIPPSTANSLTAVMMPDGHDADAFRRDGARALRHVARHGTRQARRAACSASGISGSSTT